MRGRDGRVVEEMTVKREHKERREFFSFFKT